MTSEEDASPMDPKDIMHELQTYRLVTKKDGFELFPPSVYTSPEKIRSLLAVYAGLAITKTETMNLTQLEADCLHHYKRFLRAFQRGYGGSAREQSMHHIACICDMTHIVCMHTGHKACCAEFLMFTSNSNKAKDSLTGAKIWKKFKMLRTVFNNVYTPCLKSLLTGPGHTPPSGKEWEDMVAPFKWAVYKFEHTVRRENRTRLLEA